MKILGIDPGYERCGFALLEKKSRELLLSRFGVIKTSAGDPFPTRLKEIADDIDSLLVKHQPDVISIEDLFFVKNVTTGMKVSQVRGVIIYLAEKRGIRVLEPKPVEMKQSFTGDGKADKKAMKKMAELTFGITNVKTVDDAVDAIAAAFWAAGNIDFMP